MPSYTALKPFSFGGRRYAVGDTVELTPQHGRTFVAIRKVALAAAAPADKSVKKKPAKAKEPKAEARKAEAKAEAEPKTYKTRRLKAEE